MNNQLVFQKWERDSSISETNAFLQKLFIFGGVEGIEVGGFVGRSRH